MSNSRDVLNFLAKISQGDYRELEALIRGQASLPAEDGVVVPVQEGAAVEAQGEIGASAE